MNRSRCLVRYDRRVEVEPMRSTLPAHTSFTSRHRRLLAAVVFSITTFGFSQPPSQTATVSGTVSDTAGTGVPGANIQLTRASAPAIQTKTDGKGHFEMTAGPGEYVLQTAAAGFMTDKLPTHLSATTPTTTPIVLQLGNGGCGVCVSICNRIETLNASLSETLPLTPMPPYEQTSKKHHLPSK